VQENPDLFKWLTGQQEAPGDMQANAAFMVRGYKLQPGCRLLLLLLIMLGSWLWHIKDQTSNTYERWPGGLQATVAATRGCVLCWQVCACVIAISLALQGHHGGGFMFVSACDTRERKPAGHTVHHQCVFLMCWCCLSCRH
jgi:hypothetical protein